MEGGWGQVLKPIAAATEQEFLEASPACKEAAVFAPAQVGVLVLAEKGKRGITQWWEHGALLILGADLVRVLNVCVRGVDGEGVDGFTYWTSVWLCKEFIYAHAVDRCVQRALGHVEGIISSLITQGCNCRAQASNVQLFTPQVVRLLRSEACQLESVVSIETRSEQS